LEKEKRVLEDPLYWFYQIGFCKQDQPQLLRRVGIGGEGERERGPNVIAWYVAQIFALV
jgi:hypothetical protein